MDRLIEFLPKRITINIKLKDILEQKNNNNNVSSELNRQNWKDRSNNSE